MATIGLSRPMYAIYTDNGDGTVTYSNGGVLAKAVEFSAEIDSSDDNNLSADNAIAETDRSFAGGTLTITTDDLMPEASAAIMGLTLQPVNVPGISTENPSELVYGENQIIPYLGFGVIIKKKYRGAYKWRAVVFNKIMCSVPSDAATTQGETIDWQTPELSATIMRDDTAAHNWKREAMLDSEADAELYIKSCLAIGGATPPVSTDASLASLSLGAATLSPAFDAETTSYTATTSNASNVINATATNAGATLEIKLGDQAVQNGTAITWETGENTVTVKVTAADGTTTRTYTIIVTAE